jgi:hypothetical protein
MPVPEGLYGDQVKLIATLCYRSQISIHDPSNYYLKKNTVELPGRFSQAFYLSPNLKIKLGLFSTMMVWRSDMGLSPQGHEGQPQ